MQCREFCCCERELKHSGIYGKEEEKRRGGRNNGLIQGKQCEPKLKRTDYPVRKAGGRNRQGSRGSRGGKDEKMGRKGGKEDIHQALSLSRRGKAEGWEEG